MSNLKKVPFNLDKWKADGSRVDRLETRCGMKIKDIHVFDPKHSHENIALICEAGTFALYGNGRFYNDDIDYGLDLLMYIEQPKEITFGNWRAFKISNSYGLDFGNVHVANYFVPSKKLLFKTNCPANQHSLSDLAKLIDILENEPIS